MYTYSCTAPYLDIYLDVWRFINILLLLIIIIFKEQLLWVQRHAFKIG